MPLIKNTLTRETSANRIFGCSECVAIELNGGAPLQQRKSKADNYAKQRNAARRRGVDWEITFPEWIEVWSASGVFHLRGVGIGRYCMARNGDEGPYKVGNISIQLCTTNSRDGLEVARPAIPSQLGKGRGWTYRKGFANPYQVVVKKKYIGVFSSSALAEAAYRNAVGSHLASVL